MYRRFGPAMRAIGRMAAPSWGVRSCFTQPSRSFKRPSCCAGPRAPTVPATSTHPESRTN